MNPDDHHDLPETKNRRWVVGLRWLVVILAVAAAVYLLGRPGSNQESGAGQKSKPARMADMPIPVAVEKATQGDFPVYLNGLGTVVALHTVTVRTRVDGELVRVAFAEGQMVRQGDLLAEIDPRPFQVQLQQAEGQLIRDEALLKNAEIDLSRYKTLLEQDSIEAQKTVTQEALVKQYRGTVEMDRGLVNNARLQIAYARVTAPVAGRVGLRLVDQGNIVHANDANGLVVITQIQPIAVVFTLPEDELPAVMKRWRSGEGLAVEAFDRAGTNRLATGKLMAVDNQIDATTGTVRLKAQFANEDYALFSNQFVNVKMKLDTLRSATLIPASAIQHGVRGAFVYAVREDKTVAVRPIKPGPVEGEKAAVLEGLAPNEAVVVDGVDKLREGAKVEVIQRESSLPAKADEAPGKPGDTRKKPDDKT